MPSDSPWWQTAVVYQIYPRSFLDTDGDGVGDLEGVRRRLDHIASLGVDAIWLSPFYRSPMADFGYDVSDYCDVDPLFGTMADFDRLIAEAHQRGLRVILDWVPNHSSDQHPWFVESRSSRDSAKRDWYVWRDGSPDKPPNNWLAAFGGRAWTWDETTGQWYLHLFLPEQPDLNWANPEVEAAMQDTLRFWLDRGVDGFRVDVVHALGKDPDDLPDWKPGENPSRDLPDPPYGHDILRRLRSLVDSYPGDRMMVGEVYLMSTPRVARYYGEHHDELHLSFNFPPLYAPWDAAVWRRRIDRVVEVIEPAGWPTWVLSNHDNPRHRTRYGSEARARAAAVLLLGLRGTPFLYAGEEQGLEDAVIPKGREVDPGGRDGCRAPIPWDGTPTHGWATAEPWLPWPPDPGTRNASALAADDRSILHLYRRLLAIRRASPALRHGSFDWQPAPEGVLAWVRRAEGDRRAVVVNFTADAQDVPLDGSWSTEVTSDGTPFDGRIGPDQGVVLRPRD
jgi:alpha-glucosidase